jgi:dihydroorotase
VRLLLRGVRVIDPGRDVDAHLRDVWIEDGRLRSIDGHPSEGGPPIDLTPARGRPECVVCPGFIDLHAHLREPGDGDAETVLSGGAAAAAGGFAAVVAMANTRPPIDTPRRVGSALERNATAAVTVLQVAALTQGLHGRRLTDIAGGAAAGAIAFGDDGRNAASEDVLADGIRAAAAVSRPVFVHPEDEDAIARRPSGRGAVPLRPDRPPEIEVRAVESALGALRRAGTGRLHLQHLSAAGSIELLRTARDHGLAVTAEVTPHHLTMQRSVMVADDPMRKVNPPLRDAQDVRAVREALADGVIGAIATDHAPHADARKTRSYASAAPGMAGLETALALCLSLDEFAGSGLPRLVERLTVGPHRVLGADSPLPAPGLQEGEPATLTLFDPNAEWTVSAETLASRSRNTPLLGSKVRGKVLLTMVSGRVAHIDETLLAQPVGVAHD